MLLFLAIRALFLSSPLQFPGTAILYRSMLRLRSLLALSAAKAVFASCDTSIIAHEGDPIGQEITYENRASTSLTSHSPLAHTLP